MVFPQPDRFRPLKGSIPAGRSSSATIPPLSSPALRVCGESRPAGVGVTALTGHMVRQATNLLPREKERPLGQGDRGFLPQCCEVWGSLLWPAPLTSVNFACLRQKLLGRLFFFFFLREYFRHCQQMPTRICISEASLDTQPNL